MAIEEAVNRIQYTGNNSTVTAYPVPFRFDDSDWLTVQQTDALGAVTTLTLGVNYALTGDISAGDGQITTTAAVPASNTLTISRYAPAFQTLDLVPNSPLPAKDLESALDRIIMALQDRDTTGGAAFSRSITFPSVEPTTHNTGLPLPAARKNSLIYFSSANGEMTTVTISGLITLLSASGLKGLPLGQAGDLLIHNGVTWIQLPAHQGNIPYVLASKNGNVEWLETTGC